jgi:hypothetical protein
MFDRRDGDPDPDFNPEDPADQFSEMMRRIFEDGDLSGFHGLMGPIREKSPRFIAALELLGGAPISARLDAFLTTPPDVGSDSRVALEIATSIFPASEALQEAAAWYLLSLKVSEGLPSLDRGMILLHALTGSREALQCPALRIAAKWAQFKTLSDQEQAVLRDLPGYTSGTSGTY